MILKMWQRLCPSAHKVWTASLFAGSVLLAPSTSNADMRLFTKPVDAFGAYQERPLFSPSRRPPAVAASVEMSTEPVISQSINAVLLGVVSVSDGSGLAVLRVEGQGDVQRVRVGESVNGWTLDRIESHAAIFTSGGQSVTLTFPQTSDINGAADPNANGMPIAPVMAPTPDPTAQ